jgi:hypothetical protein
MDYFTLKQTAAALGITYRKLYWHLRENNLPAACQPIGHHSPLWTDKTLDALRRWFAARGLLPNKETTS